MVSMRQCPRCLNTDEKYFYKGSKGVYCRKCVSYGRVLLDQKADQVREYEIKEPDASYTLNFELTEEQKQLSETLASLSQKENVLVYAVTGAGKTELVMESIKQALEKRQRVGIAIPRRQVVIEIGERMQKAFANLKVVYVCGGHTEETEGDLIVCTTHQLYRYSNYFDLLILDEPDAFPYKGNAVLQGIAETSCKGHMIALSATPDETLRNFTTLTLFQRPHHHPLVVPKVVYIPEWGQIIFLKSYIKKHSNVLIFVPSRQMASYYSKKLSTPCFTSETSEKERIIKEFREGKISHLVTTTVLERGVTFRNVQVIIANADHDVFDKASIIQIAGRVGRDPDYPTGDCILLCQRRKQSITDAVQEIIQMNA